MTIGRSRSLHAWLLFLLAVSGASCADGAAAARVPNIAREADLAIAPGVTLHYRILGDTGDTLVLLGGGALPVRYLESGLAPLVPMGHRLVAVDLRGRGAASQVTDTAQIGLAHDVEDLERLRVELKLEKLKLIGDHWGGTIAAMYAARYPSRVERVVMLAPAMPRLAWSYQLANYAYDPAYLKRYLAAAGAHADSLDPIGFCRAYWPFYLAPAITFDTIVTAKGRDAVCSVPPDQLRRIVPLALRIANSIGIADQRDAVKGITAPVLVLAGFRNQVYAAMYAEWLQALPTARADSVAAAAMFPWLVDPSRTYTDIDAFVRGRWPAGAH